MKIFRPISYSAAFACVLAAASPIAAAILFSSTVNNPAADTTAQDTQFTTSIVNLGGSVLVTAFGDTASVLHRVGYARSLDDGATWTDMGTLPAGSTTSGMVPVLAHHKVSDRLYLASQAGSSGGIMVYRSDDKGLTFQPAINGSPGFSGLSTVYRPWIAVDNFTGSGNGNVYLCFSSGSNGVFLTRSTDGGATFGPSGGLPISGSFPPTGGDACHVVVSPTHQVSVFYMRGDSGVGGMSGDLKLFMRRSFDRGVTFQPEIQVADINSTQLYGRIDLVGGAMAPTLPHVAVAPVAISGVSPARYPMYVVYQDLAPAPSTTKANVYYVRSLNNGASWSAPVRINDDTAQDQWYPTVAFAQDANHLMFGYYSRSQDTSNFMFHRRGRLATLGEDGAISTILPSFQLGPNTPLVVNQDSGVNALIGYYDQIAGGAASFYSTWSDNRLGNLIHDRQPDVRFARINVVPPVSDLLLTVGTANPANIDLGQDALVTLTATAVGTANDVFVNIPGPAGLNIKSASPSAGKCVVIDGFAGCWLGAIANGASKTIQVTVTGVGKAGTRTLSASATTSSADSDPINNAGSSSVTVATGTAVASNFSTGSISSAIPLSGAIDIPITVGPAGSIVNAVAKLRIDRSVSSKFDVSLVSPSGQIVRLYHYRGGSAADFGIGPNDCSGTTATFMDSATTHIAGSTGPYDGSFKPEQPLMSKLTGVQGSGVWNLRIVNGTSTGTVGCATLTLTRVP